MFKNVVKSGIILSIALMSLCTGVLTSGETETEAVKEYDDLQNVFLTVTKDTTEEELLSLIDEYGLEYTAEDYNGTPKSRTYRLAYEHGVALQSHADSGDYMDISFNQENGDMLHSMYFNQEVFMEAIYYNYGNYWDLREKEPDSPYVGYYYDKPGDTKGGIIIKYNNNSNGVETGYHAVETGEEALDCILNMEE